MVKSLFNIERLLYIEINEEYKKFLRDIYKCFLVFSTIVILCAFLGDIIELVETESGYELKIELGIDKRERGSISYKIELSD